MKNIILIIASIYSFTLLAQTQTLLHLTEKVTFKCDGRQYTSSVFVIGDKGTSGLLVDQEKDVILMSHINDSKVSKVVANTVAKMINISYSLPAIDRDLVVKNNLQNVQSGKVQVIKIKANTDGLLYLLKKFW